MLILSSCGSRSTDSAVSGSADKAETGSAIVHLLLESDEGKWFREISSPGNRAGNEVLLYPWPLSVRISDIAGAAEGAAVYVNRKGIALFDSNSNFNNVSYFADEDFTKNTAGNIVKKENTILCHIYKNTFFTSSSHSDPSYPFIEIDLKNNVIKKHVSEYPGYLSEYSLTELNLSDTNWYSAWKKSNSDKTIFRYFIHSTPEGKDIKEITENSFKSSVQELDKGNASPVLKNQIDHLLKIKNGTQKIIDLTLRDPDYPAPINYSVNSQLGNREKYEKISAAEWNGRYFFAYGKNIYTAENDKISMLKIESLPENYYYTSIYYLGGKLYAAWEQQQFYLTGEAGLSIIDEKKVDKITQ
ncbi:MAG: hypothetical protein RBT69_03365 [Spirochaetia bacterium]|jgi:hypothetical protein|nr:hypothetical protein [Spirochaetia bacterium]